MEDREPVLHRFGGVTELSVKPTARSAILIGGFLLILLGSLSVHVVMLQVLNVPYPANLPANGWARLPDRLLSVLGAVTLYVMLPGRAKAWPVWQQAGLLFLRLCQTNVAGGVGGW